MRLCSVPCRTGSLLALGCWLATPMIAAAAAAPAMIGPPAPRSPAVTAPVELSSAHGRYEIFWTPTADLLLFDSEGGSVWIRHGVSWVLMPRMGGDQRPDGSRVKATVIVLDRAVRALRDAEAQLQKAYGASDPSVIAIRGQIDDLTLSADRAQLVVHE